MQLNSAAGQSKLTWAALSFIFRNVGESCADACGSEQALNAGGLPHTDLASYAGYGHSSRNGPLSADSSECAESDVTTSTVWTL